MKKWIIIGMSVICMGAVWLMQPHSVFASQGKTTLEQAVRRAAIHCYAVEGIYPSDVAYLEEKYGVLIDHDTYIVDYELFAANVMPQINVLVKK